MRTLIALILFAALAVAMSYPPAVAAKSHKVVSPRTIVIETDYKPKKHHVRIAFKRLHDVSFVSYTLTYKTNGVQQGISGSFAPHGNNREIDKLLLGTCSASCVYDKNITNIQITVKTTYNTGLVTVTTYTVRS